MIVTNNKYTQYITSVIYLYTVYCNILYTMKYNISYKIVKYSKNNNNNNLIVLF